MALGKSQKITKKNRLNPKEIWFQPILWWAEPFPVIAPVGTLVRAQPRAQKQEDPTSHFFTMFYGITTTKMSMGWLWLAYSCSTMLYTNIIRITWLRMYIDLLHISAVLVQWQGFIFRHQPIHTSSSPNPLHSLAPRRVHWTPGTLLWEFESHQWDRSIDQNWKVMGDIWMDRLD